MNPQEGGRFLNQLDMDERRRVVFIGDQLAVDLFGAELALARRAGGGAQRLGQRLAV